MHWASEVVGWTGLHILGNRLGWLTFLKTSRAFKELDDAAQEGTVSRFVSTYHAVFSAIFSVWALMSEGMSSDPMYAKSAYVPGIVTFSLGYMFADLINETRCWRRRINYEVDFLSITHHWLVIATGGLYRCVVPQTYSYVLALGMATEVSTPLVNLRWMSVELKWGKMAETLLGVSMMTVFGLVRLPLCLTALGAGLWNIDEVAKIATSSGLGAAYTAAAWTCTAGITAINGYWFSLMVKGLVDVLKGEPAADTEGKKES